MQATGGVADDGVVAALLAGLHRIERDRRGVAALGPAYGRHADALSPGLQLVGGRGAERVGGTQQHRVAVGDEHAREPADGRGLAGAVDADHEDDARRTVGALRRDRAVVRRVDRRQQLLAQDRLGALRVGDALDLDPGTEALDQLLGRRDADVGGQQGVLDLLPGVLVETVPAEQRQQATAERRLRPGEPLAQTDEPSGRRRRLLDLRCQRFLRRDVAALDVVGVGLVDLPWLRQRRLEPVAGRRGLLLRVLAEVVEATVDRVGRGQSLAAGADHEGGDAADHEDGDDQTDEDEKGSFRHGQRS